MWLFLGTYEHLFTSPKASMTDQRNGSIQVQLGEPEFWVFFFFLWNKVRGTTYKDMGDSKAAASQKTSPSIGDNSGKLSPA